MGIQLRTLGIVATILVSLAGCGENNDTILLDNNDNDGGVRTATPIRTPTPGGTAQPTAVPTEIEATDTPAPDATETPVEPTSTAAGPTEGVTATPTPVQTVTPSPAPTSTAAAAFCGNGTKEEGEDCDSGTVFSSTADCSEQCACCRCRPDSVHAAVPMTKCSTCHPSIAPALTYPPGAAATFPGLCE